MGRTILLFAVGLFIHLTTKTHAFLCESKLGLKGSISGSSQFNVNNKCWNIRVPSDSYIRLTVTKLNGINCNSGFVKISVADSSDEYKYCDANSLKTTVTALNDVTVTYSFPLRQYSNFEIQYVIQELECSRKDSFRCTEHSCIPRSQVCDGIKQCSNGADEAGCETGVLAVRGVAGALDRAVSWMKERRAPSWGWGENTPRAVVALFLSSAVNFNGTDLEEELMAKQAELKTAVDLYRSLLTNNELSMLVNALLVTCHNPRHFYGKDLVRRLKSQVESTKNFTHPIAYLALCNANETWPNKAYDDLNNVLGSNSDYPFVRDIQAMAVMALSCIGNQSISSRNDSNTSTLYWDAVKYFKTQQLQDGSFGNVHTTALIIQALIASGQELSKDWKLNSSIEYVIRELNSTSADFLSMYLALPLLNGKTLVDISKNNCSANPRKHGDDIVSEINDYLGFKIRIKYYLYLGDEKDVIHSISLRVPENFTAYEVMKLAQAEDPKYKFEEKKISGKIYIYKIANITNDPEVGKFWLQYIRSSINEKGELKHFSKSPAEITMKDGDHLVMWYKTAHI